MTWIYRFDEPETGRCLYVGKTRNLKTRNTHHRSNSPFGRGVLVPIRKVPDDDALRVESQVIQAYKRRGQADYNQVTGGPWSSNPEFNRLLQAVTNHRWASATVQGHTVCLVPEKRITCLYIDGKMSNWGQKQQMHRIIKEWEDGTRNVGPAGYLSRYY